ncbi:CBS domain-containing protein [Longispora sp. K20-0274]|uniref:CBS domain-containing protein n=1 Tax=Longispora sp. K20-0274 TaxID=3088255 RepID=UPI00399B1490
MRVRDVMTRPVHTVRIDTPVAQVAAILTENRITAVPVLDGHGGLVGMVSEADLLGDRGPNAASASALWDGNAGEDTGRPSVAGEVMTSKVISTPSDADIGAVAELMVDNDVHSMPVVDDEAVVGMISRGDLLRVLVRTDDILAAEVQHRLDEYSDGTRRWTASVTDGAVTVDGTFLDDAERHVVEILARTVPGVRRSTITLPR